jgi:CRP/FNR family cyclic AMP-dependent transcriptional regulator
LAIAVALAIGGLAVVRATSPRRFCYGPAVTDPKRALWYLKKVALLAEAGADGLARIAEHVELREVRRRDVVYLPGDGARALYFVCGGRVKICKVTRDGKSLTLGYCGPGDMFGEAALVGVTARTEMAEAIENALLAEIAVDTFDRIMAGNPGLAAALTRAVITRRIELENKVEALVFRDVSAKLAEQLIKLADDYGVDDARGTLVGLKITHQELANLIGSTRETVSLTLSQFKRQRWIVTDGRKVILSDVSALRALF